MLWLKTIGLKVFKYIVGFLGLRNTTNLIFSVLLLVSVSANVYLYYNHIKTTSIKTKYMYEIRSCTSELNECKGILDSLKKDIEDVYLYYERQIKSCIKEKNNVVGYYEKKLSLCEKMLKERFNDKQIESGNETASDDPLLDALNSMFK